MLMLTRTLAGALVRTPTLASPCGCVASSQRVGWVQREREGERLSGGRCFVLSNLASEVILCPFYHMLCTGIKSQRPQNFQTHFNATTGLNNCQNPLTEHLRIVHLMVCQLYPNFKNGKITFFDPRIEAPPHHYRPSPCPVLK